MTLKLFKGIYEFFIKLVYEDEDVPMMMQFVYEERLYYDDPMLTSRDLLKSP